MAQFYASIRGQRGEATRCGSTTSGMQAHVRGWDVGARVVCFVDKDGRDVVEVYRTSGSNRCHNDYLVATFINGEVTRISTGAVDTGARCDDGDTCIDANTHAAS